MSEKVGYSDSRPEAFQQYNGGFYYNYNISEVTVDTETGSRTQFQFNYVWVDKIDKEKLIEARIRTQYSQNDEYKMARIDKTTAEWVEYNGFVEGVIAEVEGALNE